MTKYQDVGDATESSQSSLQDLGNSTVEDVKQQINNFNELNKVLDSFVPEKKAFGLVCSVKKVMDELPQETQDKLNKIMENKDVMAGDICLILKNFGFYVSHEVMRRHRRRKSGTGCNCK